MSNLHRPRQFDLIAFDWDGTLYDSTQIIVRCIQAAVTDVGGQTPTHDLLMANNAGCASVGVSYGAHGSSGLEDLRPRAVVHNVAELHGWLLDHA